MMTSHEMEEEIENRFNLNQEKNSCKGNGGCLVPKDSTLAICSEYVQNPNIRCLSNCQSKKCPNFVFCKRKCPEWILNCNCGLCDTCSQLFGSKLKSLVDEHATCQICQKKDDLYLLYKHCQHFACRNCFSYSFTGTCYEFYDIENEPKFPYSQEVEEEYYDDEDAHRWAKDNLIQKL